MTTATPPQEPREGPSRPLQQANHIRVGASVQLSSIEGLANDWGLHANDIAQLLDILKIPKIKFPGGDKRYVNLYSLETSLFCLGLPEELKAQQQSDPSLLRLHQELAGVLYAGATRETIRYRVKQMAKAQGWLKRTKSTKGLKSGKRGPIIVDGEVKA